MDPSTFAGARATRGHSPSYPPAPWHLRGWGFCSAHLADVAGVRALVPPGLRIVTVLPGRTLAALYFASYEGASSLEYHELAIAVALVWHRGRPHAWAPQLYVDNPASVAGGRAIWGLRKTLASFEHARSRGRGSVTVHVGGNAVCSFAVRAAGPAVPLQVPIAALGMQGETRLSVVAKLGARVRLASAQISLPPDSPHRPAFARRAFAALFYDNLDLSVPQPR